jgi:hypothetical protein
MTDKSKLTEQNNSQHHDFGSLGKVSIIESHAPSDIQVFAKTVTSMLACADGTLTNGPTFSDDTACGAPPPPTA